MKKVLALGFAAVAVLATSQQQASAWHKCTFGAGVTFSCEGGGNTALWGLLRGAPTPDCCSTCRALPEPGALYKTMPAPVLEPSPMLPYPNLPERLPPPKSLPGARPGVAQPVGFFPPSNAQ